MPFAQLVIGAPGSGKSTYCDGMHQFLNAIGRKSSVVNLDPANERTSYPCALDVRDLITLEEIMSDDEQLGPNGGILYALEELEENFEWLEARLEKLGGGEGSPEEYVLFDCPGQVELFTHHNSLRGIFRRLEKMGYRPSMYISALLLSLRTMLQMDMSQVNVLTKIDNLSHYPDLPFNLDFYTEVQDLSYLLPSLGDESRLFSPDGKFAGLNRAVVDLVEEFGLVGYETLAVEDKKSIISLLQTIDRASGYAFGGPAGANDTVWQVAVREGLGPIDVRDVQERWLDAKDEWDEKERSDRQTEAPAQDSDAMEVDDQALGSAHVPNSNGIKVIRRNKQP